MTKIVGYVALLYGREFLHSAIRSVIDSVDEMYIIYDATEHGSHGTQTQYPCPDKRHELIEIAWDACKGKMHWQQDAFVHEGHQRMSIHRYAPDADAILVVDSDEIYEDGLADEAIEFALTKTQARTVRIPFQHQWRSFHRGFLHDPAYPHRVIVPKRQEADDTMHTDKRVWHFGYSIRPELVQWKWLIHGHRSELRPHWFRDVFMTNRQYDCHPCGNDSWNAEDIDQVKLPSVLKDHPYKDLSVIGEVL